MDSQTISIVTPSLNQGRFIAETIESVWSQRGPFYVEHLIMDGGSTDGTVEIIRDYETRLRRKKFPVRSKGLKLFWTSKPDRGQSHALNIGFSKSKGAILTWLNSDDYYNSPDALTKIYQAFGKYPDADLVTSNFRTMDVAGNMIEEKSVIFNTLQGYILPENLRQVCQLPVISQPATFFRRKVLEMCRIDEKLHYSMDWDLWIQAYEQNLKFFKIKAAIANERIQPEAKTVKSHRAMYREWTEVYKKHNLWQKEKYVFYKHVLLLSLSHMSVYQWGKSRLVDIDRLVKGLRP